MIDTNSNLVEREEKKAEKYAKKLRSRLNTPVYYVAVAATLLGLLFRISGIFSIGNISVSLAEAVSHVDNSVDLSAFVDRVSGLSDRFGGALVIIGLILLLPMLLQTVGLLSLSLYAIRGKGKTGLGVIRVGVMMDVVYLALLSMIAVLACIFGLVAGNYAGDGFMFLMLIVTVVTAIVFILLFCYRGSLIRLTDYLETALAGKRCYGKGPSRFLLLATFFSAVISLIGIFLLGFSPADSVIGAVIAAMGGQNMGTAIIHICSVLSISMFGVLLMQVRRIMPAAVKRKHHTHQNPPANQPPRTEPLTPDTQE